MNQAPHLIDFRPARAKGDFLLAANDPRELTPEDRALAEMFSGDKPFVLDEEKTTHNRRPGAVTP